MQKCHEQRKKKRAALWLLATAGALLAACGETGGGGNVGGGGAGGGNGEGQDAEISLTDVGTGGNVTPGPDAAVGGQPVPGGTVTDAAVTTDAAAPVGDAGADAAVQTPDAATVVSTCGGHEVIDLNAHLAANAAYEGTTAEVAGALAASCGGAAGGEVVFSYRVDRPLNHLTVRTDFPETQAPTVVYVRVDCEDPVDLVCNRGTVEAPGTRAVVDGVNPGLYYIVVDTGSRDGGGAFRLTVEEDGASACRDLEDNDGDGLTDLLDPGCELPDDDTELDPPTVPACADTLDNDGNGQTDYPNDPQCDAAGDTREGPVCALDVPFTDVGVDGGLFPTALPLAGNDLAQGNCYFEPVPEHLFVLTLDRPAVVTVTNRSLNQLGIPVTLFARTDCAAANTELACAAPWQGSLNMGELQPGTYFVFAELSQQGGGIDGGPVPLGGVQNVDIEFNVRPSNPTCSDGVDNDRDALIDLLDPGCEDPRDQDETDPGAVPYCANGVDDDADGTIDFPNDEGCAGAGDACEEAGFDLCDGVCQDVVSNPQHCGLCGRTCDAGVECIEGYCGGLYGFEGYRTGVPVADLAGWVPCFTEGYGDSASVDEMVGACDGEFVLLGCRAVGAPELELAAMGETAEVFRDTGDGNNDTHEHNGVGWYFSLNTSIGFVPAGAVPARNSCDTDALPDWGIPDDGTGEGRMCWHTGGGATNSGFRCGMSVSYDNGYERIVYTTRRAAVAVACADGIDNDADGLVDADDLGCESPYDGDESDVIAPAAPACANGVDDDDDGGVDYPADPDCLTAGDVTEVARCGLGVPVTEVDQAGGQFLLSPVDGDDGTAGSCGDGLGRAHVLAVTLTDPSNVVVTVSRGGVPTRAAIYVRSACDDAESELRCAVPGSGRLAARNLDRGTYYIFVERLGRREDLTVDVAIESLIRECNDGIDNDQDELIDNADLGCRTAMDPNEADDPEVAPACGDGVDNDEDGFTDWPLDPDCVTAGDAYERLLCQPPTEVIDLPGVTAVYPLEFGQDPGPNNGSCGDGRRGEIVYLLHLDDPSRVSIGATPGPIFGNGTYGTTYLRSACDEPGSEIACAGDNFNGQPVRLARLEAGDYFVFVEDSVNWDPADPNVVPELHVTVTSLLQACENGRDDDGDGLIDLVDLGCEAPADADETDVAGRVAFCANEQDDDGDGNVDYPADDGCSAAGDPCEQVDYLQCDGVCLDGSNDAANCGQCGRVCDAGVECIDGVCGGLYVFEGVANNVPVADLDGWEQCFQDTYDMNTPIRDMTDNCNGEFVLIGCREAQSGVLYAAAMGETAVVFTDTGDGNNALNQHNGVGFYFSQNTSIGFVPGGAQVSRNSCDTLSMPEAGTQDDGTADRRMCWHTSGDMLNNGFRCGSHVAFDPQWERVAFRSR